MLEAVKLEPDNLNMRYTLACIYRDSARPDEALAQYQLLLNSRVDYPNVYNDLGDIYFQQSKFQQAQEAYLKEAGYDRQRLRVSEHDIVTLNDLAYALNGAGDSSEAKELIDKAIAISPGYRQAYLTLAKIHEKNNRPEEAIRALQKSKELSKELSKETNFIDREINRLKSKPAAKIQ